MEKQVRTPILVVVAVAAVAVMGYFGMKAFKSGDLDQGQVPYTPGTPPWKEKDPSKRGPGGSPGGGGPGAPPQPVPPPPTGPNGGPPPGMTAPVLGNGK